MEVLFLSCAAEARPGDESNARQKEQIKGLLSPTLDDIKVKMNKTQGNSSDDDDDEDCKPTTQEKKQAKGSQDTSDSDDNGPTKKKRKKESFSLGSEVLCQHMNLTVGSHHTLIQGSFAVEFKKLISKWQNWMPSGENIITPSMHMRIYSIGREMNLGSIGCISMHQ